MIWYEFHISFNGIYPIVKRCPVGHCSKYKAWKYLKEQYPNSFVSYAGKYSDDYRIKDSLNKLKFQLNRLNVIKLKLLNNGQSVRRIDLDIVAIKHEIRQLEFRLT